MALFVAGLLGNVFAAKTYSDNGDGTVTDSTTALIWMRCFTGQAWSGNTCTGTASTYTWDQANTLTGTVTFAGKSDWRVPNIRELTTIVDLSVYNPAIDQRVFPATPSSYFWSGSPVARSSGSAWNVFFGSGVANYYDRGSSSAVRLVRGGQSLALLDLARATTDYVDQGDGTATHSPTGLMWKRCAEGQTLASSFLFTGGTCTGTASTYTWDQANALTGTVTFAGQSDWRLPSQDELLSLVDYTRYGPAIHPAIFVATPSSGFWSGSLLANSSGNAWSVFFASGFASYYDRGSSNAVRLVRGQPVGTLALTVIKSGAGTVSSVPSSISCGATCTAQYYPAGTRVILTATPTATAESSSTFTGWSGACTGTGVCAVTMDAAKIVTATFKLAPFKTTTTGVTVGFITTAVATVATKITVNTADLNKTGSTFITAWVPANALGAVLPKAPTGRTSILTVMNTSGQVYSSTRTTQSATATGTATSTPMFILTQLTLNGWSPVISGQLLPYASGVLTDLMASQTILNNTDTTNLAGSQFCVGYGTSAEEMIHSGRLQLIATIPNPNATNANSGTCTLEDTDDSGISLDLIVGWNLVGNSSSNAIDVLGNFSDANKVATVWKWNASAAKWAFYAPSLVGQALTDYVAANGYEPLTIINPGEGFWINTNASFTVPLPVGTPVSSGSFSAVPGGWRLISVGDNPTPSMFNEALSSTLPPAGRTPTNLNSLWAWDATNQNWYFYAPTLEAQGGTALTEYISNHGFEDFTSSGKTLGPNIGFWVNRP